MKKDSSLKYSCVQQWLALLPSSTEDYIKVLKTCTSVDLVVPIKKLA